MTPTARRGYAHLGFVYFVWGSVYIGVKVAIANPGGFSAFQLQSIRLMLGALILAAVPVLRGNFRMPRGGDLVICVICGLMFWTVANGLAVFALIDLQAGFVAMALATIPLWTVIFQALVDRRPPPLMQAGGVLLGFVGLAVIVLPVMQGGPDRPAPIAALAAVLAAPLCWVSATMIQRRIAARVDSQVAASLQLGVGAIGSVLIALVQGVPLPADPRPDALLALVYLAIFGSALGFRSYVLALRALPAPVVSTFAYVNPVVSLTLGWLILGEQLTLPALAGMAIIIASVAVVLANSGRKPADS